MPEERQVELKDIALSDYLDENNDDIKDTRELQAERDND
jgi:hypothetical protein